MIIYFQADLFFHDFDSASQAAEENFVMKNRVTTCMENLENSELSGILTAVREMSGILLKVSEMSGKCQSC